MALKLEAFGMFVDVFSVAGYHRLMLRDIEPLGRFRV